MFWIPKLKIWYSNCLNVIDGEHMNKKFQISERPTQDAPWWFYWQDCNLSSLQISVYKRKELYLIARSLLKNITTDDIPPQRTKDFFKERNPN